MQTPSTAAIALALPIAIAGCTTNASTPTVVPTALSPLAGKGITSQDYVGEAVGKFSAVPYSLEVTVP